MRLERRLAGLACWRVLYEAATLMADAEVAELADAEDSKSSARKGVGVRLPSSALAFSAISSTPRPLLSAYCTARSRTTFRAPCRSAS